MTCINVWRGEKTVFSGAHGSLSICGGLGLEGKGEGAEKGTTEYLSRQSADDRTSKNVNMVNETSGLGMRPKSFSISASQGMLCNCPSALTFRAKRWG